MISIDYANRMLPLLRHITGSIMETWDVIVAKRTGLQVMEHSQDEMIRKGLASPTEEKKEEEKIEEMKADLNQLVSRINEYIKEIENLGCFVQEFKRGIINIPTLLNGRKVMLCWMPEDKEVCYWHESDEMASDKRPINDTEGFYCATPPVTPSSEKMKNEKI